MGKLTLLLVMAAALGGSFLTFHARSLASETRGEQTEVQEDLLARDAATSALSVIVHAMIGEDGFLATLPFRNGEVPDGRFTVDGYSAPANADGDRHEVSFTVTGHSGGAIHTIRSRYDWDPMEYPGPLWLDVPYATAQFDTRTVIDGGTQALPTYFDPRLHTELQLEGLVPIGVMDAALRLQVGRTRGVGGDYNRTDLEAAGLLEDLNVSDARDLYYAATSAHDPATDPALTGPITVTNRRTWRGNKIAVVHGDLTIGSGGRVEGDGALVVEGALTVAAGGQLDWDGLVIVHSETQHNTVSFDGVVRVDGAVVVSQLAIPPGGHMDLTVNRDVTGSWPATYPYSAAAGERNRTVAPYYGDYPFYQHTHRYDVTLGDRVVPFVENGAGGPRASYTQFYDVLQRLGNQEVSLELANTAAHGYAHYTLDVRGEPEVYEGMVSEGFPSAMAAGASSFKTKPFPANDLRDFSVDVRSLRSLQKLWDGQTATTGTCAQRMWPICVGDTWGRNGALTVRLKSRTSQLLYEGSLYWHMQEAEHAEHLAEEAAWRDAIQSGQAFGTALRMGPYAAILFTLDPIEEIGKRLNFDGPEVLHVGTWAQHEGHDEGVALGRITPSGPSPGGTTGGTTALVAVCHRSGEGQTTLNLEQALVGSHLLHGDTLGACPTGGGGTGGTGTGSPVILCHTFPQTGRTQTLTLTDPQAISIHQGHGDPLGACLTTPGGSGGDG